MSGYREGSWEESAHRALWGITQTDDWGDFTLDEAFDDLTIAVGRAPVDWECLGWVAFDTYKTLTTHTDLHGFIVEHLAAKQHSYGHGNINAFGLQGLLVRCSDKLARIENLKAKNAENDPDLIEPFEDAYLDLVGYSVIALMLIWGTFDRELAADMPPEKDEELERLLAEEAEIEAEMLAKHYTPPEKDEQRSTVYLLTGFARLGTGFECLPNEEIFAIDRDGYLHIVDDRGDPT